jgi:hypothetical protein
MRYLESTTTKASPDMFWANLDVYRLGVESSSGFFCPLAESVERTASSMLEVAQRGPNVRFQGVADFGR